MTKKFVRLTFPQELIKEPIIYKVAKDYNIIPNIRRAKVTENVGEVILELEGSQENLEKSINYLENLGVKVEPIVGDILE